MTELEEVREAIAKATREMVMSATAIEGNETEYRVEREKLFKILRLLQKENLIISLSA